MRIHTVSIMISFTDLLLKLNHNRIDQDEHLKHLDFAIECLSLLQNVR